MNYFCLIMTSKNVETSYIFYFFKNFLDVLRKVYRIFFFFFNSCVLKSRFFLIILLNGHLIYNVLYSVFPSTLKTVTPSKNYWFLMPKNIPALQHHRAPLGLSLIRLTWCRSKSNNKFTQYVIFLIFFLSLALGKINNRIIHKCPPTP